MKNTNYLKWTNAIALLVVIVINALANLLPLGGYNTGQISQMYPNLFTPAPITFAIWGVIYLLLVLFAIFQFELFGDRSEGKLMREDIGLWFAISCIMNIGWIFTWHFQMIELSVVCMAGLLVSLIVISIMLNRHQVRSLFANISNISFQVYLGWITAATIANISVLLVKLQWNRFGLSSEFWMIAILIVGALLGSAFVLIGYRPFATLAVIWAYIGILIRYLFTPDYQLSYMLIVIVNIISMAMMFAALILSMILRRYKARNAQA